MCKDEETHPVPLAFRDLRTKFYCSQTERTSNATGKEEEAHERMWRFYEGRRTAACAYDLSFWTKTKRPSFHYSLQLEINHPKNLKSQNSRHVCIYFLVYKSIIIIIIIIIKYIDA
jgi:hypothetical protein